MFEEDNKKQIHAQWFTHSSKTILQETADPKELFLINECADVMLSEVLQKAQVRMLGPEEDEPADEKPDEENDFYCRYARSSRDKLKPLLTNNSLLVNEETSSLLCLPSEVEISAVVAHCETDRPCYPCGQRLANEGLAIPRPLPGRGFTQWGNKYHLHDFVYLRPAKRNDLYVVAQIVKVKAMVVPVRLKLALCSRSQGRKGTGYSDNVRKLTVLCDKALKNSFKRRLFQTTETVEVSCDRVDGKCWIKHLTSSEDIEDWSRHDDHYYVIECQTPLQQCFLCLEERTAHLLHVEDYHKKHGPLRGMDLFSGILCCCPDHNATADIV
jgi:DNA (cytosine-5)-methyltransferase 1